MTLPDLAEPGYDQTLRAKVVLFAAVLLAAGVHGMAVGRRQDRQARLLGIATPVGSVGVAAFAVG
jgi:hypothetical protein